jgi:hypothetical protein
MLITKLYLTLNLLTTTIVAPPSNVSKWQMGFNSAFKGLIMYFLFFPLFFVTESQIILDTILLFQDSQDGETVPVSQSTPVSQSERAFAHPPIRTK